MLTKCSSPLQLDKVSDVHLCFDGVNISPLDHVHNLGETLDLLLMMTPWPVAVSTSCDSCVQCDDHSILTRQHTLDHAFVTSRVD